MWILSSTEERKKKKKTTILWKIFRASKEKLMEICGVFFSDSLRDFFKIAENQTCFINLNTAVKDFQWK